MKLALCGSIEGRWCRFRLRPGANRVGRAPSSDILLPTSGVSKCHALIFLNEGGLRVEDLASKNGTSVNGKPVGETELRPGDEIEFGPVRLKMSEACSTDGVLAFSLAESEPVVRRPDVNPETPYLRPGSPEPLPPLAFPDGYVAGHSPGMIALYRQLLAVVDSDLPVLLVGETGVGKEYLARILHASAYSRTGSFIGFNCAAIPAELLESELFGIGDRVATGVAARRGRFLQAEGGTLFLDEIAEMSTELQAKVLRALQEGEIDPVGSHSPVPTNARIVASTNLELDRLVREEGFRPDLYYRLAGLVVQIPPLRKRREDIPSLVESFLIQGVQKSGRSIRGITVRALEQLAAQPWPGNVRELEHVVHRLVYLCLDGQAIGTDLIEETLGSTTAGEAPRPAHDSPVSGAAGDPTPDDLDLSDLSRLDLGAVEKRYIEEAMRRTAGNRTHAAALLGISRDALRRRLAKHQTDLT